MSKKNGPTRKSARKANDGYELAAGQHDGTHGQNGGADDVRTTATGLSVHEKLDNLTTLMGKVLQRLDVMGERVNNLEDSMAHMQESIEEVQNEQKLFATKEKICELEKKLDDLGNRSRRNNIVMWGVPECQEEDCEKFVLDFIKQEMEITREIELERAHRSPAGRLSRFQALNRAKPRPIHVKFLRFCDREEVLRKAPKCLKNKKYKDSKVFITDDVTEMVRAERKKLVPMRNKLRADGKYAVIPWTVPACLIAKSEDGHFKRITVPVEPDDMDV